MLLMAFLATQVEDVETAYNDIPSQKYFKPLFSARNHKILLFNSSALLRVTGFLRLKKFTRLCSRLLEEKNAGV